MATSFPSAGAERLAAAGAVSTVARQLGVADRTVAGWRAGKIPNRASQESIERVLGIPTIAWSRIATDAEPRAAAPAPAPAATTPPPRQSAEARLREQLDRLRAQREAPGLTERSRVEIEKLELQASARLARLEGATGLTMAQVRASPHLSRVLEVVVAALHDSPLELFGVLNALELLEDRGPTYHLEATEKYHPAEVEAVRSANAALLAVMMSRAKCVA